MDRDVDLVYVDCSTCGWAHPVDENGDHICPEAGSEDDGDDEDLTLHCSGCEMCGWPEPYYGEDDDDKDDDD